MKLLTRQINTECKKLRRSFLAIQLFTSSYLRRQPCNALSKRSRTSRPFSMEPLAAMARNLVSASNSAIAWVESSSKSLFTLMCLRFAKALRRECLSSGSRTVNVAISGLSQHIAGGYYLIIRDNEVHHVPSDSGKDRSPMRHPLFASSLLCPRRLAQHSPDTVGAAPRAGRDGREESRPGGRSYNRFESPFPSSALPSANMALRLPPPRPTDNSDKVTPAQNIVDNRNPEPSKRSDE